MGIVHMAKFMDEPRTEQEWHAWGHHLHGPDIPSVKADDEDTAAIFRCGLSAKRLGQAYTRLLYL